MKSEDKYLSEILSDRRARGGLFGPFPIRILCSMAAGASTVMLFLSIPIQNNPDHEHIAYSIFLCSTLFWFYALTAYALSVKRDCIKILRIRGIESRLIYKLNTELCPEDVKNRYAPEHSQQKHANTDSEKALEKLIEDIAKQSQTKKLRFAKRTA